MNRIILRAVFLFLTCTIIAVPTKSYFDLETKQGRRYVGAAGIGALLGLSLIGLEHYGYIDKMRLTKIRTRQEIIKEYFIKIQSLLGSINAIAIIGINRAKNNNEKHQFEYDKQFANAIEALVIKHRSSGLSSEELSNLEKLVSNLRNFNQKPISKTIIPPSTGGLILPQTK